MLRQFPRSVLATVRAFLVFCWPHHPPPPAIPTLAHSRLLLRQRLTHPQHQPAMRRRLQRGEDVNADRIAQLLHDEGVVLDTAEQAEVVQALEAAHAAQTQLWRFSLGALGFALGSTLVWFGFSQARRPWVGYRHHSVFHRTAPAGLVAVAEVLSGAAVLLAAAGFSVRLVPRITARHRRDLGLEGRTDAGGASQLWRQRELHTAWSALLIATVLAVFWAWLLRASLLASRVTGALALKLLWLPLAPAVYAGLVVAVLRMLQRTEGELAELRRQMYVFYKA